MRRTGIRVACLALALGACGSAKEGPTPSTAPATVETSTTAPVTTETVPPESTSSSTPTSARATTTVAETRISATVAAVFASAKVIELAEPVQGFSEVALTASTRYRRSSGQPASLSDVRSGSTIQVTGVRSSATALVAREVVIPGG